MSGANIDVPGRSEASPSASNTVRGTSPSDTAASCNLEKNPNENKQFEVTI